MSDFSEICPLFNTGVFNEVTFPGPLYLSAATISGLDFLAGTASGAKEGYFTFGRTVVVTGAYCRRLIATNTTEASLWLVHKLSGTAALAGTIFGTITLELTGSGKMVGYTWAPFTVSAAKTFTSDEVLSICIDATTSSGAVEFIVRYKEK